VKALGWRVMGVSHDRNTQGPLINRGNHPISPGGPLPKRDGPWESTWAPLKDKIPRGPVFRPPLDNFLTFA